MGGGREGGGRGREVSNLQAQQANCSSQIAAPGRALRLLAAFVHKVYGRQPVPSAIPWTVCSFTATLVATEGTAGPLLVTKLQRGTAARGAVVHTA